MSVSPVFCFDVCHEIYAAIKSGQAKIPIVDTNGTGSGKRTWHPVSQAEGNDYAADFAIACRAALAGSPSRLILCNLFYIGLTPYETARHFVGLREDVWSQWADEIREKVGKELMRRGMFPPRTYFGERARPRRCETKRTAQSGRASA